MAELFKILFVGIGKEGRTLSLMAVSAILTCWVLAQVRSVERNLDKRFNSIELEFSELNRGNEQRFKEIDNRLNATWTVDMMSTRDVIVAKHNTNLYIPSDWEIFQAVKSGKVPIDSKIIP